MGIDLSLIIPAYNEAERLPPYLRTVHNYLSTSDFQGYEVIVVDDGSQDRMAVVLARLFADWPQLSTVRNLANLGKGAAVRRGVLEASGRLILFADADGATPIEEERKLRAAIEAGADLSVGSRLIRDPESPRTRRWLRGFGGTAFALLVRSILSLPVHDTQCGFKMFRHDVGIRLFKACREDGYLFDVHIVALAERLGYKTSEVAIRWSDVPGSKLHLIRDPWRMIVGLLRLRRSIVEEAARAEHLDPGSPLNRGSD